VGLHGGLGVLVLFQLADEFGAVGAQAGKDVLDDDADVLHPLHRHAGLLGVVRPRWPHLPWERSRQAVLDILCQHLSRTS
jgi:hypothetical protein